jgi:hypothetical protein
MKPIVHYYHPSYEPEVGKVMFLKTRDHPSPMVTNNGDGLVMTSVVVSVGINGVFETHNTKYVPDL